MISGSKKKEKLIFAKNKQQAISAVVAVIVFIISISYTINKVKSPNPGSPEVSTLKEQLPDVANNIENNSNNEVLSEEPEEENLLQDADNIYSQTISLKEDLSPQKTKMKLGLFSPSSEEVEIIPKNTLNKSNGKTIMVTLEEFARANPFLPEKENYNKNNLAPFLTVPPETLPVSTDATKVITTTVSGILYDKYSPSAILNIEGADYLVKKGDVINHYKVLSISQNQVTVQLGKNIYKAGVGQLLSKTDLNHNTIANLNKKFGGNNNIEINVKKKGY